MTTIYDDADYRRTLDELERACGDFMSAHHRKDSTMVLFMVGALVARCADIYNLAPPGGVFDPRDLFREE